MRLFALLLLMLALPAHADELRPGYIELTQVEANQWRLIWKAPIREGLAVHARALLPSFCETKKLKREIQLGSLIETAAVTCRRPLVGEKIVISGMDASITDVLARVAPLDRPVQMARLTADDSSFIIAADAVRLDVAKTYLLLGIDHILWGFDHLLFVLSLVLLIRGGWTITKTVTAFTVAHSITLAATSLQLISLPRQPVEICIALSIIFLAVEIVKSDPQKPRLSERLPWLVAFAFGLLHGFGFAAALAEIGLPQGEVAMALFTFNIGVEIGQLMIVAAGCAGLFLAARLVPTHLSRVKLFSAYAIGIVATTWFFERIFV